MTICMSRKYTDKCFETVPNINMVTSSPCRSTSLWRRWRRMTLPMRLEIIKNDQIHFTWYLSKCGLFDDRDMAGLHKLRYPVVRDMSTWSKFGAHGEHGDVFLFSNLGALWFSENLIRYSLHICLREVKNNLFSFKNSYLRHFSWRF